MIKVFMMQHEENNISNYQSAVGEYESFEQYLKDEASDKALPNRAVVVERHVDEDRNTFMAKFIMVFGGKERVFIHFAQQIK
jgi:ASC-1-like (ASCH) protein